MTLGKYRAIKTGLALAVAIGFAGSAIAGAIVVRSSGPSAKSYPPGRALDDTARISLRAGDQLVILDGRGTRTVSGPGVFSASAPATASGGALATAQRILSTQGRPERRGGAVRGTGGDGSNRSPNLWFVDVGQSSTVCVADPANLKVWRADASADATLTLTGPGGASTSLPMAKNVSIGSWPADRPVTDGAEYVVSGPAGDPARIKFALLGPTAGGIESTAAALIERGCDAQLDLLIETVALPGSEAPSG